MQDMDQVALNMENDLSGLRGEMRYKATNNRVDQIELHLHDYSTKEDFNRIRNQLESYTTLENFNKMRVSQERT